MVSAPLEDAFRELPTAAISDALDSLGLAGQCLGILPLDRQIRLVGRAFTVRYRAAGTVTQGTVGDYIDDVKAGEVCVLDNGGRLDCTVWGDILTMAAHKRAVAGTVINGVCRDVLTTTNFLSVVLKLASLAVPTNQHDRDGS
jgi:4-hydroxy-4-methyl-2-oxoglutarate aldolase